MLMKCENCRWWGVSKPEALVGECRRFPPQARLGMWEFPLTDKSQGCGEFHPMNMRQVNEKASEDPAA